MANFQLTHSASIRDSRPGRDLAVRLRATFDIALAPCFLSNRVWYGLTVQSSLVWVGREELQSISACTLCTWSAAEFPLLCFVGLPIQSTSRRKLELSRRVTKLAYGCWNLLTWTVNIHLPKRACMTTVWLIIQPPHHEPCWLSTPHANYTVILTNVLHATALLQWGRLDNCDMLVSSFTLQWHSLICWS